jgi:hypothetical protein
MALGCIAEDQVLGQVEFEHETALVTVLWDVRDARRDRVPRRAARDVLAQKLDGPGLGLAQADDGLDGLALTVAADAGDPEDLPPAHDEVHALDRGQPTVVGDPQVDDINPRLARLRRPLLDAEHDVASDHHACERHLVGLGWARLAHDLAVAHDDHAVGDRQHLLELVRDEYDRQTLVHQGAHDGEELRDLLGREDSGRLVEDEDARALIQRF